MIANDTLRAIKSGIKWNKVSGPISVFHSSISQSTTGFINVVLVVIIIWNIGIKGIKRYGQKV